MAKIIKTRGIVLNTRNFKESSLFASVLTSNHGRIQILAKGCRRPHSKLCGTMERLNLNEIIFYKHEEKETYNLSDAVIIDDFAKLRNDPQRMSAGLVLSEFLEKTLALGQHGEKSYTLIFSFLRRLQTIEPKNIRLYVYVNLLRAIAIAGVKPHLDNCVRCGATIDYNQSKIDFSALGGGVVCNRDYDDTIISLQSSTVSIMNSIFKQHKIVGNNIICEEMHILVPEYIFHQFGHLTLHTLKYLK